MITSPSDWPTDINNIIEEASLKNCNPVTTPGIAHYKPTVGDEALLDKEQHKRHRRVAGKLQWLAYTRPDIAYSTKEFARDLTAPTELSNKRVKHLLRYLQGTKHDKFIIQPTTTLNSDTNNCLDLEIYVDANYTQINDKVHFKGHTHTTGSVTEHECVTTSSSNNNNNNKVPRLSLHLSIRAYYSHGHWTFERGCYYA